MLSNKTKYAIKALIYLAQQEKGALVKTADISTNAQIPKKFLEQILIEMKHASIVASRQGIGGGYFLLKSPAEVNLRDIHRILDGAIALLPCASEKFYQPCRDCPDEQACALRWSVLQIRDQTLQAMAAITLEKMVARQGNPIFE
jgi:Rrf2 family protein